MRFHQIIYYTKLHNKLLSFCINTLATNSTQIFNFHARWISQYQLLYKMIRWRKIIFVSSGINRFWRLFFAILTSTRLSILSSSCITRFWDLSGSGNLSQWECGGRRNELCCHSLLLWWSHLSYCYIAEKPISKDLNSQAYTLATIWKNDFRCGEF